MSVLTTEDKRDILSRFVAQEVPLTTAEMNEAVNKCFLDCDSANGRNEIAAAILRFKLLCLRKAEALDRAALLAHWLGGETIAATGSMKDADELADLIFESMHAFYSAGHAGASNGRSLLPKEAFA